MYPVLSALPILGILLKIFTHKSGAIQLEYTFDDEKADEYNRRIGAWKIVSEGYKEWQIIQEANVTNQKVNAEQKGASREWFAR